MKWFFIKVFFIQTITLTLYAESVTILGAGYVGLIMGSIFAKSDYHVNFVEIDEIKIANLKKGELYYQEKQLNEAFKKGLHKGSFSFYSDPEEILDPGIVFICTDTPNTAEGKLNTSFVYSAIKNLLSKNPKVKTLCVKSTLQPNTMRSLVEQMRLEGFEEIRWIYNPEFMREGSAIDDILMLNPIVISSNDPHQTFELIALYQKVIGKPIKERLIITDFSTAELIKLAWNGFSAMRITYANELSQLCSNYHGDIAALMKGISFSEKLLPTDQIKPGCGYGGSCFPKDTLALASFFQEIGFDSSLIHQTIDSNQNHIQRLIEKVKAGVDKSSKIAILGFSFKANTNDIRNTPTRQLVNQLAKTGVELRGYDPFFNPQMALEFPTVYFDDDLMRILDSVDCVIVMNDAKEIQDLDLSQAALIMKKRHLFDFKNVFDPNLLESLGFDYYNLGRIPQR